MSKIKIFFFMRALPMSFQILAMATDLVIIAAILVLTQEWGLAGLLAGLLLAYYPVMATGGPFYAWKPTNVKTFWANWRANVA